MIFFVTICLVFTFGVLSILHLYWGFGGLAGFEEALPTKPNGKKLFVPTAFDCFVVSFGLLFFAFVVMIKAQWFAFSYLPNAVGKYGIWAIACIFLLRAVGDFRYVGFLKSIKNTDFAKLDTTIYAPLCLLLGIMALFLALAEKR